MGISLWCRYIVFLNTFYWLKEEKIQSSYNKMKQRTNTKNYCILIVIILLSLYVRITWYKCILTVVMVFDNDTRVSIITVLYVLQWSRYRTHYIGTCNDRRYCVWYLMILWLYYVFIFIYTHSRRKRHYVNNTVRNQI